MLRIATPTPELCRKCAHAWNRGYVIACTACTDPLNEEPLPCHDARKPHNACGPDHLKFRPIADE